MSLKPCDCVFNDGACPDHEDKTPLRKHFEANMLDGEDINGCGGAMLSAKSVLEYLEEYTDLKVTKTPTNDKQLEVTSDSRRVSNRIRDAYTLTEAQGVLEEYAESLAKERVAGCHCVNVKFGSYANTVSMKSPFITRHEGWVSIDTCIATEIGYLWHQGVDTLNSCCGHGKLPASVIVSEKSHELMDELDYKYGFAMSGLREYYLRSGTNTNHNKPTNGSLNKGGSNAY